MNKLICLDGVINVEKDILLEIPFFAKMYENVPIEENVENCEKFKLTTYKYVIKKILEFIKTKKINIDDNDVNQTFQYFLMGDFLNFDKFNDELYYRLYIKLSTLNKHQKMKFFKIKSRKKTSQKPDEKLNKEVKYILDCLEDE
jgi:hypothetical protein